MLIALAASSLLVLAAQAQLLFPANQIPFDVPPHHPVQGGAGNLWTSASGKVPRIAIIGAGAGGSSAAYFLKHFADLKQHGLSSEISIFEGSDYVGGRSTVVWPWHDDPYATPDSDDEQPVELGASIFVEANKNLRKAVTVFNLTLVEHAGEEGGGMSIWDGAQFAYTESKGWGWGYWDLARMWWRYGRSPLHVRTLVKETVADFSSLYSSSFVSAGAYSSLASFASATNLSQPASLTALEYFTNAGISQLFTTELIAAGTTVNYGSSVAQIHAVGALVSLAATGATAVLGGNRKIFQGFIEGSGANVKLGKKARVTEIVKLDSAEGERTQWIVKAPGGGGTFDAVILAAPFHHSGIKVLNSPAPALIPPQPYVSLHVAFVLTNASAPLPSYFAPAPATTISKAIFATFDTASPSKPKFNSLNYLKQLSPEIGARFGEGTWHVVKMFSKKQLDRVELEALFGEGNVGKVWEKVWDAYPQLDPVTADADYAPVRPDEGLYYVNAFERLISTMETETVAAFNVVSLLLQDFYGYTPPRSWAEWDAEEK